MVSKLINKIAEFIKKFSGFQNRTNEDDKRIKAAALKRERKNAKRINSRSK